MAEPDPDRQKGGFRAFFSTLPGVLMAVAALITAVAGVLALFVVPDDGSDDEAKKHVHWVDEADRLCSETTETIRGMPELTAENITSELPEVTDLLRRLAERLRELEAAGEDEAKIARLTALIDEEANEFDQGITLLLQGRGEEAQRQMEFAEGKSPAINAAAESLGASACGQTAYVQGF